MLRQFLDLIFPHLCLACQNNLLANESIICTACWVDMPLANDQNNLGLFQHQSNSITELKYLLEFTKHSKVQEILHQIKYNKKPKAATELGKTLANKFYRDIENWQIDAIVPIPIHPKRMEERGYNQSEKLAEGIVSVFKNISIHNALVRVKNSGTQTKMTKEERYQNVKNAFEMHKNAQVQGKNILLIDDVATTLATLDVCAEKLLNAGAKQVFALTLAGTIYI